MSRTSKPPGALPLVATVSFGPKKKNAPSATPAPTRAALTSLGMMLLMRNSDVLLVP